MPAPILVSKKGVPSATLARATLAGAVSAVDQSGPGLFLELNATLPYSSFNLLTLVPEYTKVPASTLSAATLYSTVKGVDQSAPGVLRLRITTLDQSTGVAENAFRIAGRGTRAWSFLDATVSAGFRHTGVAERRWTMAETRTGELRITGRSTRLWSGTELGEPEAFRINGTGTRTWFRSSDTFRITGTSTRKWTMAGGIDDECLTADGESEPSSGYGTGLYGEDVYGDSSSEEGGGGSGQVKNYVY